MSHTKSPKIVLSTPLYTVVLYRHFAETRLHVSFHRFCMEYRNPNATEVLWHDRRNDLFQYVTKAGEEHVPTVATTIRSCSQIQREWVLSICLKKRKLNTLQFSGSLGSIVSMEQ